MSLGNKLTWYLLVGVLLVMGLDVYFSLQRTHTNLLNDVRREVASISRTLRVSLEKAGDDDPQRYFTQLAPEISGFENVLGVVFYDLQGRMATLSPSLHGRVLPEVDVRTVIATKIPIEGVFTGDVQHRYYRVEPIVGTTGQGLAAFLVIEDFPFFTRELRGRMVQAVLTILMLSIVLSAIVSVVIRQGVSQPLRAFTRRVEETGEGQFEQRLQLTRRDEIGRLAQAFDHMCSRLEEAYEKLIAEGEEKVRLERALRHSEKLAALGEMASRLAHEIGTPLNVIQGRAEQLLRRNALGEKERAFLGVIVAQIERISGFIRQLLTLARRPEPQLRPTYVNDIVRRVWDVMGNHERADRVELVLDLADTVPPIVGDPDQLQQVVLNLSVNAVQAVGHTGRVTVRTRVHEDGDALRGDSVEIEVADTGPGIAGSEQARVFEPFFTTKGMEGGTGLGLAICREVVLNHHGEIRVESEEGNGTRFIVSLPIAGSPTNRLEPSLSPRKEEVHGNGIA
jgi:signal transduction histidine kinase